MPPYNPNEYVSVQERIDLFHQQHPSGAIRTEVVAYTPDLGSVIVRAMVFADAADAQPVATGIAQEHHNQSQQRTANTTHWVENCETSAIGRALANMSYATSKNRPSREEMAKMERYGVTDEVPVGTTPTPVAAPNPGNASVYQQARDAGPIGNGATPQQIKAIYAIKAKLGWDDSDLDDELAAANMSVKTMTRQDASGFIKYLDSLQQGS